MRVLLHYRASPGFRAALSDAFRAPMEIVFVDEADDAAFARALPETDAILHVLRKLSARDIEAGTRLKLVQKIGVGVNTIDLEAAKRRGVAVCNMPGTNSAAVAEMTLMLMLAALRRVHYFDALTRQGNGWRPETDQFDRVGEIGGRTIGLVGFGAVPQHLAPVLTALGAEVIYTARAAKPAFPYEFVPRETLFARSDIVSLHCPATAETVGLLSREAIAAMKPGAILVNTARGELVDEGALADALARGQLAAAGLDVFGREPTGKDNPLFALSNVVVAPHIAWLTPETLRRSIAVAVENCRRVASGEPLLHRVV